MGPVLHREGMGGLSDQCFVRILYPSDINILILLLPILYLLSFVFFVGATTSSAHFLKIFAQGSLIVGLQVMTGIETKRARLTMSIANLKLNPCTISQDKNTHFLI